MLPEDERRLLREWLGMDVAKLAKLEPNNPHANLEEVVRVDPNAKREAKRMTTAMEEEEDDTRVRRNSPHARETLRILQGACRPL